MACVGWFGAYWYLSHLEVRNFFFVSAVEGDWTGTGSWHRDGWIDKFGAYSYCGNHCSINPFGDLELDNGFPAMFSMGGW